MNGLDIFHVLKQAEKLKDGLFNNKEVYILYDKDNIILKKDSKMNAADVGKENFEILLKEHCYRKE